MLTDIGNMGVVLGAARTTMCTKSLKKLVLKPDLMGNDNQTVLTSYLGKSVSTSVVSKSLQPHGL